MRAAKPEMTATANSENNPMKTISPSATKGVHPMTTCLAALVLIAAVVAPAAAETVLFEDGFEVADPTALESEELARRNINLDAGQRQSGSMAPTEYSVNGAAWQYQLSWIRGQTSLRMFPMAWHGLALAPGWKLDPLPGNYALSLKLARDGPNVFPGTFWIALGAGDSQLGEGAVPNLSGSLMLRVTSHPEPSVELLHDGIELAAQSGPEFAEAGTYTLRWSQESPGAIANVEVLLDGQNVLRHEGSIFLKGEAVVLDARARGDNTAEQRGFVSIAIDDLRYVRE